MTTKRLVISCVMILMVAGAFWARMTMAKSGQDDARGFRGTALRVVEKAGTGIFLTHPEIKTFGDRAFVGGAIVNGKSITWINLSLVAYIEEYPDLEAMSKVYEIKPKTSTNRDADASNERP